MPQMRSFPSVHGRCFLNTQPRTHGNSGKTASAAFKKDARDSNATNPDSLSCNRKAGWDSRSDPIKNPFAPNNLLGLAAGQMVSCRIPFAESGASAEARTIWQTRVLCVPAPIFLRRERLTGGCGVVPSAEADSVATTPRTHNLRWGLASAVAARLEHSLTNQSDQSDRHASA